jgi:hypothetical protein
MPDQDDKSWFAHGESMGSKIIGYGFGAVEARVVDRVLSYRRPRYQRSGKQHRKRGQLKFKFVSK